MRIVPQSVELLSVTENPLAVIEAAGRTCYKSEDRITDDSSEPFAKMLLDRGHEAMVEFGWMAMRFVCDRGVSHEMVRHRLFSFAQESTRYCNYASGKHDRSITVIRPPFSFKREFVDDESGETRSHADAWEASMRIVEASYFELIDKGQPPEIARSVLPNSLKTEICVGGNMREWRHFFNLRTSPKAHPQMREVALMALKIAQEQVPVLFDGYGQ